MLRLALLLLLVVIYVHPSESSNSALESRQRLRREPPTVVASSALWPDSSSGEPIPRAKAILNAADTSWGGVWIPLDAVYDAEGWMEAGMKMTFNSVHDARVGMRIRVTGRDELQRRWKDYRYSGTEGLHHEELTALLSQADRAGVILELDRDDNTARIKLDPVSHESDTEL